MSISCFMRCPWNMLACNCRLRVLQRALRSSCCGYYLYWFVCSNIQSCLTARLNIVRESVRGFALPDLPY
jgi:hypothetical protein